MFSRRYRISFRILEDPARPGHAYATLQEQFNRMTMSLPGGRPHRHLNVAFLNTYLSAEMRQPRFVRDLLKNNGNNIAVPAGGTDWRFVFHIHAGPRRWIAPREFRLTLVRIERLSAPRPPFGRVPRR